MERRDLPSLTSLRFVAAGYVLVHHCINVALLATEGADADRSATWLRAWGTQGHVGVTFFFVLSGAILAWCYHAAFAAARADDGSHGVLRNRFWHARWARVWPLHAATALLFVPLALQDAGPTLAGIWQTCWQGVANIFLLHAWLPVGGPDGLADTLNAPSWTLSVEACFYLAFPAIMVLLVRRWQAGSGQLLTIAAGSWILLGGLGIVLQELDPARSDWIMRVFPLTRLVDFVVGVCVGLLVVQHRQRGQLAGAAVRRAPAARATTIEAVLLFLACIAPLLWATWAHEHLPATLGTSWFYLPVIAATIHAFAREEGALSQRVLAARWLVWLGEVSYALYLTHLGILLAAYRLGAYEHLGVGWTTLLVVVLAIAVAGMVHVWFERPARSWLVARYRRRSTMQRTSDCA